MSAPQAHPASFAADLNDVINEVRARMAARAGRAAPAPTAVRYSPQPRRPEQPLPQGFDVEQARAELAALEAAGPAPVTGYSGEAAAEMEAWAQWMHAHRVAGLRRQIAAAEALQQEAA